MKPERYQRVREVYHRVCDESPSQWGRLLDEHCGDDRELRGEVEQLLTIETRASDRFLESPPPAPEAPERIGRYRIVRVIGDGGMGVVYEAEQEDPRRNVALKVIRPGMVTKGLLRRFRQEAQVLGQLKHPGIAQIHEAGTADSEDGGRPFFAMELIEGVPLLSYAESNRLEARERLELIARVCDALHHAHQKGVIHRDLKPPNILVTAEGQPKVLDFGVARVTDADIQTVTLQTDVGQLVGTLPYMSPEQASGDPLEIDTRADIYALGVIAYELLAGRLPYDITGKMIHEAVRVIREEDPTRLSSIDRGLRGDVETIVAKALAKEKERRYQSAAELAADIRRYLADEPVVARPTSAMYQLRKFTRRNKALVTAAAAVFLAMLGATLFSLNRAGITRQQKDEALRQAQRATVTAAASAFNAGEPVVARQFLEQVPPADRNWEWHYLKAQLDQSIALIEPGATIAAAGMNADGSRVVTVVEDGAVRWWDPFSAEPLAVTDLGPTRWAAFTRDGTRMVTVEAPDGTTLRLWDVTVEGDLRPVASAQLEVATMRGAISDDGSRVVASGGGKVTVWTPASGAIVQWPKGSLEDIVITPRGNHVGIVPNSGLVVTVYDANSGDAVGTWSEARAPRQIALAADGSRGVVGNLDKRIRLRDVGVNTVERAYQGHAAEIRAIDLSPDERFMVSGGSDQTIRLWDVAHDRALKVFTGHEAALAGALFSSDGTRILSWDSAETVRLWTVDPEDSTQVLRGHTSYVYAVALSADGKRIYSGAWDKRLQMWDAATGALLKSVVPDPPGWILSMAASPRGDVLAVGSGIAGVHLWDGATLEPLETLPADDVDSLSWSADGSRLAARAMNGSVVVWDVSARAQLARFEAAPQDWSRIALSHDGTRVASANGRSFKVWDVASKVGREVARNDDAVAFGVAWHPDGTRIALGWEDGVIEIVDAQTLEVIHTPEGHTDRIYALAFSPDGTRLASGSNDTTIRLWDVASGEQVARLLGHADYVYDLEFSPDGRMLASASGDFTVRIWDTVPERLRRRSDR